LQLSKTAKTALKQTLAIAQTRGGLIYVTGYARQGETRSTWQLDILARGRAEVVSKYLSLLGARQWITFHGVAASPSAWNQARSRQLEISTVSINQL
jgi:hypothetical protein